MEEDKSYIIAVQKLFETVRVMHKNGYENVRLMSYFSPSGMYLRVYISVKKNFDDITGFIVCKEDDSIVYRYSTGSRYDFFGEKVQLEDITPEELSNEILKRYPKIEELGKGEDKEYVDWFRRVLYLSKKELFPYAFSDYGYDIYKEKKILLTDGFTWINYAPAGDGVNENKLLGFKKLDDFIKAHQDNEEKSQSFVEYLYSLMDKYKIDNPAQIYNRANISRQLWSSIISEKSCPSLNVCIKIALAMHLNNHECKYLLKKAGYTLASASKFALIVRYAIENKIYDIDFVNEMLISKGCADSILN